MSATRAATLHTPGEPAMLRLWAWALSLSLAALSAYAMLRALGLLPPAALLPAPLSLSPALAWLDDLAAGPRLLTSLGALVIGTLALWMLVRRDAGVREAGGGGALHVLTADELGLVVLANGGLEAIVATAARATPGVFDARVRARPHGRGVQLALDIQVLQDTNVPRAANLTRERAVAAVERLVGLPVDAVRVRVDVLSAEQLGRLLA